MKACYRGHTTTVDTLVSRGADVNAKGQYNLTGLVWACGRGHYDIVELLLEHNVKVDAGDKFGTTCLIWASRAGKESDPCLQMWGRTKINHFMRVGK